MKNWIVAIIGFVGSSWAFGAIPFANIEGVRSFTIVARVAMDNPNSPEVKTCGVSEKSFASLGQKLALATENMKAQVSRVKLTAKDVAGLKSKTATCESRGSCSVYRDFLEAVQIAEVSSSSDVEAMKNDLDTKLTTLKSVSYVQAWKTVKTPCNYLKHLMSWK